MIYAEPRESYKIRITMSNREMIAELKRVQPMRDRIVGLAEEIVRGTFDRTLETVDDLSYAEAGHVCVHYTYCVWGDQGWRTVNIPIEWFDEGFDYAAAYKEMLKKEKEERMRKAAAEKERRASAKKFSAEKAANKEYESYLKLKKKYENGCAE